MTLDHFQAAARLSFPQTTKEEIWEWASKAVDFGTTEAFKGKYNVMNVPWTKEILRAFRSPYVREITAVMPPQESGKTKSAEVCMAWRVVHQPAKMSFNTTTNSKADAWSETRLEPLFDAIPSFKERMSANRNKKKRRRIVWRDGSFLLIQGAEVPGNRQSDSVEVQINDELMLWERPWMKQMHTRTRAYEETKKILNISLGGKVGGELQEHFLDGNQGEWSHLCPACGRPFSYNFNQRKPNCNVRFDLNAVKQYDDGRLDLREFEKTIYTHCTWEHCSNKLVPEKNLWAQLNRTGVYVPRNPDANPAKVSLHVSSLAIGRRPWVEILEPWVRLNLRGGIFNQEILEEFITHELAEFWEDRPIVVSHDLKLGSYLKKDVLKPGNWKDEWVRVMLIDNQRGKQGDIPHRWYVCRAFARDGRSRLVDCGRINEWEEVRKKQLELGVPDWSAERPGPFVCVDRRWNPVEVDEICAKWKWFGLMGYDQEEFQHSSSSDHAGKRMPFSEERFIDIGFGTQDQGRRHAVYYLWASQKVQDYLAALRDGKAESWEVPADIGSFCPEYADHINSHRQKIENNTKNDERRVWYKLSGWADHLYDCESMAVVLGLMAGVFQRE